MTFHVKNEETTIKGYRSRLLRAQMYTGNGFYFAKWHWCYFFRGEGGVFWKMTAHSDCVVNPTTRSLSFFIGSYCWCKLDFDLKVLVQCACTILTLFNVSQSF